MKIASLNLDNIALLAPMAGISDSPYRRIMKSFGASLVYSEMISANGLIRNGSGSLELLHRAKEESPFALQLFGDDPQVVARAADQCQHAGELIDLNMGCPVKKVVRSGAGSALMRDPQRVGRMVSAVRRATTLPLTVKIRSGWDSASVNFLEIGRIAEAEGADAVTLHPRTRTQGFGGRADWTQIARLKQALSIPVIGSGDIFTADDGVAMLEQTGCDAVMIGRGGYGNPWLIRDLLTLLGGGQPTPHTPAQRCEVALRHLALFVETYGPRRALLDLRKHCAWYSRGLPEASTFRAALHRIENVEQLRGEIEHFFGNAQRAWEEAA